MAQRRVKIVATVGPAIDSPEALERCVREGVNVFRLNFSHGDHVAYERIIRDIREISHKLNAPVAILQDLQGPKVRVGKFKKDKITLNEGHEVIITTRDILGEDGLIPTDFKGFVEAVQPGQKVLLDDGLMELRVDKVLDAENVLCTVIYGGELKNRKGINIPGAPLAIECLTEKDEKDLAFGLDQQVDYVALSFVRRGEDIRKLRRKIQEKAPGVRIVAKIEMLEALDHLEEIVRLSDAVMVARGDLAIEAGQTVLPIIQKRLVKLCNSLGKPVITATQMLDSMVENPRPTRAEITDVANAVLDGTDALMLSAETANGKHPFECIRTMHEISLEVEKDNPNYYNINTSDEFFSVAEAIGASACLSALKLNASAIVCLTTTGKTATIISRFRPRAQIIAMTHIMPTLNRLELAWGIQTLSINPYSSSDEAMAQIEEKLLQFGLVKTGDRVLLTFGAPVMLRGKTNTLRVFTIGGESIEKHPNDQLPLRCR